jgi:ribosomal protein L21
MNDDFAVIRVNGRQFVVKEGEEITTDKLEKDNINVEVLLLSDNGKLKFGDPVLKSQKVSYKLIGETFKGKKVKIFKYKSKSRYRKSMGFRPQYSKLSIDKLS